MRSILVSLLGFAAFTRAQSIMGTYYTPDDGNDESSTVPDVSVIGVSTITDSSNGDVGFMTIQTVPNPTTTTDQLAPATVTQCWKLVTAESSTTRVAVQPTLVDGGSPPGIQCWIVYQGDGGIISLPIPHETASSASDSDSVRAITLVLPIVLSLVGVILLAGGILTFFHVRNKKRRAASATSGEKRAWFNRKTGWVNTADEEAGITRPDIAQVAYH